jgi:rhodanese-related sulfurtransferase
MKLISVHDLRAQLTAGSTTLIDVRTDEELAIAALPGALHLPMAELQTRLGELDPDTSIAVLCHHGVRSEMAARFLERNGFKDVSSVVGGIEAWSSEIDATVPRY